jgi:hypothetical protein
MDTIWEKHSSELVILALVTLVMVALFVLVPQLLRVHQKTQEQRHAERIKAIEHGMMPPPLDERARAAGRTALLVPSVTVVSAATVTCFLVAYRSESLLAVTISVWSVAGVVSLAAITGSVALIGRLAQLDTGELDEEEQRVTP